MPPDSRPERPARRDHWPDNARNWSNLGPPLRPSPDDTRFAESAIAGWRSAGNAPPRALLLGVTPELAGCRWPPGTRLVAVDRSRVIIDMLWPAPGTPSGAQAVCADWRAMPFDAAAFDIVVGDGCYVCLTFPDDARALGREVARVLASGGVYVTRVFLRPEIPEPLDDIIRDLADGAIGSIHALKWRIAAATHGSTAEGVRLADIWENWHRVRPLAECHAEKQGGRRGWRPAELATLDIHRGVPTRYCMPTIGDFRAIVGEAFQERCSSTGSYELADRCRTFVLGKRAE